MELFDELKELGVDVDSGLKRINGNQALYSKLLGSFVKGMKSYRVEADFDASDVQEMIEKTHTIKGISGNMSITPVYEAYTKIVDLLRTGKPEEARAIIKDVLPVQEQIISCIEKHMG